MRLVIGSAVNNEAVLNGNLLASAIAQEADVEVLIERGARSAGSAYNRILDKCGPGVDAVVLAHQDVYLPTGWRASLESALQRVDQAGDRWAVLGVWGVTKDGKMSGRVWCNGGHREHCAPVETPVPAVSLDETVLVINPRSGIRFDENLPGFHLYGTDVIVEAERRGFGAFVFNGPIVHNSRSKWQLDRGYREAYRFMQRKWRSRLPLRTCVGPLQDNLWSLRRRYVRVLLRQAFRPRLAHAPHPNPRELAQRIGYEPTER